MVIVINLNYFLSLIFRMRKFHRFKWNLVGVFPNREEKRYSRVGMSNLFATKGQINHFLQNRGSHSRKKERKKREQMFYIIIAQKFVYTKYNLVQVNQTNKEKNMQNSKTTFRKKTGNTPEILKGIFKQNTSILTFLNRYYSLK